MQVIYSCYVLLCVFDIKRINWWYFLGLFFLLFFKVQFRIVSMDANFIPVARVVSLIYLLLPFKMTWDHMMGVIIPASELRNLVWFLPSSQWIWRARSILVQESGRWREGCLLILKTAWVWSAVWSSVINMLSEFIWHTLRLTQTSESIRAPGLFRLCRETENTTACSECVIHPDVIIWWG